MRSTGLDASHALRAYGGTAGCSRHHDSVSKASVNAISRELAGILTHKGTGVLDADVGEDLDAFGREFLAIAQTLMGFAFDDALVGDVGADVDIHPDKVELAGRGNPERRERIVAKTVDADGEIESLSEQSRYARHEGDLTGLKPL